MAKFKASTNASCTSGKDPSLPQDHLQRIHRRHFRTSVRRRRAELRRLAEVRRPHRRRAPHARQRHRLRLADRVRTRDLWKSELLLKPRFRIHHIYALLVMFNCQPPKNFLLEKFSLKNPLSHLNPSRTVAVLQKP